MKSLISVVALSFLVACSGPESTSVDTHGSTIRDHAKRISILENARKLIESALKVQASQIEALGSEQDTQFSSLSSDLSALTNKVLALGADLETTKELYATKEEVATGLAAAMESINQRLLELSGVDADLQSQIDGLTNEMVELEAELELSVAELQASIAELTDANAAEHAELQEQLNRHSRQLRQVRQNLRSLDREVDQLRRESRRGDRRLNARLDYLSGQLSGIVLSIEAEFSTLRTYIDGQDSALSQRIDSLSHRMSRINNRLRARLSSLESRMSSVEESVSSLESQLASDVAALYAAIANISLTPGPVGPQGLPGEVGQGCPADWRWKDPSRGRDYPSNPCKTSGRRP
jgi:chromosome segregation ATPase